MQNNNLVLIGMPGAGKSTTGVIIAKKMRMDFIDVDLLIQKHEDALLQEIIDRMGFSEFLKIEEKTVLGLKVENTVIAPGGSVIYSKNAIEHLKKNGMIIYLRLTYREIELRLNDLTTRGIVFDQGCTLKELYSRRSPLYEKYADKAIDCSGLTMEQVADKIVDLL